MPGVEVVEADLARIEDQHAIVDLLDAYSRDPMGNGQTWCSPALAPRSGNLVRSMSHLREVEK